MIKQKTLPPVSALGKGKRKNGLYKTLQSRLAQNRQDTLGQPMARGKLSQEEAKTDLLNDAPFKNEEVTEEPKPDSAINPEFYPFKIKEDGVYFLKILKKGGIEEQRFCSPLEVVARTCNEEGQDHGRLLRVTDAKHKQHEYALPMTMTAGTGNEYRANLKYLGLEIDPGRNSKQRLESYLNLSKPDKWFTCVTRIGWHSRHFVLPDIVFSAEQNPDIILQGGPCEHAFQVKGSLAEWQEHIGRSCPGNSLLLLSVSAAFAAPLLLAANAESGGIHFVGGTSIGKTTAAKVAGSVCGGGRIRGYLIQWRATANGLEAIAAAHCDCLLVLDELGQADAKTAGEAAYMLANGVGKVRAKHDGSSRKPQEWRIMFLSTGEITLSDKLRENGKKAMAGQSVRVVDITADAGAGFGLFENLHGFTDGSAFARHLAEASDKFYGSPLRAFLEKLTANYDDYTAKTLSFIEKFTKKYCPADADG